ncbi:MAG: three-Cys-motif partner protein TcmP [Bellilinea sp.]
MAQDSDNFFQEQKDWSKRKLSIIQLYLAGFTKILGSSTSQSCVYYVDGFAGKGVYDDGSKGSPVLAAEMSQTYRNQQKKYQLNCINIEADNVNFQNLENSTTQYQSIVENLNGTFSSHIPSILKSIGKCPAFFFIDPFGVTGTDWIDMTKVIHRAAPTDLWLRFDHKTVRRLSGFFESGSRGADSKVQRLLKLYGVQRADHLFQKLDGNTREERIENAVNYYLERLESELQSFKKFGYSAGIPIISLAGQNKYHLVFAASHPKAVILASETVYSVERNRPQEMQEYQQKKTGQLFLFSSEPSDEEISKFKAEELIQDIWRLCSGKQLDRLEIYMKLLNNDKKKWFGRFSGAHLNLALSIMESETNPRIAQRTGAKSQDKTAFKFK